MGLNPASLGLSLLIRERDMKLKSSKRCLGLSGKLHVQCSLLTKPGTGTVLYKSGNFTQNVPMC